MQDSRTFEIKIGYTSKDKADLRVSDLETGNPGDLYILATRPGEKEVERQLHKQFGAYHVNREWFKPGPELINYIVGCAAVEMARVAVSQAVQKLVSQSFPETKEEIKRRQEAAHQEDLARARQYMDELRKQGVIFGLASSNWPYRVVDLSLPGERRKQLEKEAADLLDHMRKEVVEVLRLEGIVPPEGKSRYD